MKNQISITILCLLGGLLGFYGWNFGSHGYVLLIFVPTLWILSQNRLVIFILFACYYMGATYELLYGAYSFLNGDLLFTFICWGTLQLVLPTGWIILWKKELSCFSEIFLRLIGTFFIVTFIPPYSFIGLANPLLTVGHFFPGTGYWGFLLYIILSTLLVKGFLLFIKREKICPIFITYIFLFFGLIITLNLIYQKPSIPKRWIGLNTHFGQYKENDLNNYSRHLKLKRLAQEHIDDGHKVIIFPEMITGKWTDIESNLWEDVDQYAKKNDAVILLGVQKVISNQKYNNVLIVLGDQSSVSRKQMLARLPMPIGNWKPWARKSAQLNISLDNNGTVFVSGKQTVVLFCYETMLFWPILQSMLEKPEMIMLVSNLWWAKQTKIPNIMTNTIQILGRLFGVPVVVAINIV